MRKISTALFIAILTSCSPLWKQHLPAYKKAGSNDVNIQPDYNSLTFWAAHPAKNDPSDSVPSFLRINNMIDTSADVFFIYPTIYTDQAKPFGWNAPILQPEINARTDYSSILYQASIFNFTQHVYAPRYRQANLNAYYTTDTAGAMKAFRLAYTDVKNAFSYYLEKNNHGRPIIIASHSQGTTHAKWLLRDFFEGKPLLKQLVVAYIIGLPVEPDWFTLIKPCIAPLQNGCFCSWRTFKNGYETSFVKKEKFTAVVTNPLTWSAGLPSASRYQNVGGVLRNFNRRTPAVSGASIHNGILWVDKPRFFGNIFLTTKNYHIADLNLFYVNIRENARLRLKAFNANR